jgi:hypothetical protein
MSESKDDVMIGTLSEEIARARAEILEHPRNPEAALERFAARLQAAWNEKPFEPFDAFQLLAAIQATLQAVRIAGHSLDKAFLCLFLLSSICIAQLLALAMLR